MNYVFEIIALIANAAMAAYQAQWFDWNLSTGKSFNHWPWAIGYTAMAFLFTWFDVHNAPLAQSLCFLASIFLIRMVFFNFILNRARHPQMPWFYIHSAGSNGSIVDRIELLITNNGKLYPLFWSIYAAILFYLQFRIK